MKAFVLTQFLNGEQLDTLLFENTMDGMDEALATYEKLMREHLVPSFKFSKLYPHTTGYIQDGNLQSYYISLIYPNPY